MGEMISNPDPSLRFSEADELIMIGTDDAEKRFFEMYPLEGIFRRSPIRSLNAVVSCIFSCGFFRSNLLSPMIFAMQ
jgi:hypothetical protein